MTPRFWLGPLVALAFIREDYWVHRFSLRKSKPDTKASHKVLRSFHPPKTMNKFTNNLMNSSPLQRTFHPKVLTRLECFLFVSHRSYNLWKFRPHSSVITEQNAPLGPFSFKLSNSWESQNLWRFKGDRFLPNSPTWLHGLTWPILILILHPIHSFPSLHC
jgi:hypothetical protein